jgi:hypothetical protein
LGLVLNRTSAISFEEPPGRKRLIPPTTLLKSSYRFVEGELGDSPAILPYSGPGQVVGFQ